MNWPIHRVQNSSSQGWGKNHNWRMGEKEEGDNLSYCLQAEDEKNDSSTLFQSSCTFIQTEGGKGGGFIRSSECTFLYDTPCLL